MDLGFLDQIHQDSALKRCH